MEANTILKVAQPKKVQNAIDLVEINLVLKISN